MNSLRRSNAAEFLQLTPECLLFFDNLPEFFLNFGDSLPRHCCRPVGNALMGRNHISVDSVQPAAFGFKPSMEPFRPANPMARRQGSTQYENSKPMGLPRYTPPQV